MSYYTTQYKSNTGYFAGEVLPLILTGGALLCVLLLTTSNRNNIRDLNYHSHNTPQDLPVNSDGEYLYLSGAWF